MTTIDDVARRADVSVATAIRALSNAPSGSNRTRARVLAAAETLAFEPGPGLRDPAGARTQLIGLVFPYPPAFVFGDPNLLEFMRGAEQWLARNDYSLALFPAREQSSPESGLGRLLEMPFVDGAIIVGTSELAAAWQRLRHRALPVVALGYLSPWGRDNTIHANNRHGAYFAIRHLLGLGHTRIGLIDAAVPLVDLEERLSGAKQALAEARLMLRPELLAVGDLTESGGAAAAAHLLSLSPRPTAIFAFNDRMAMGAIHQIKAAGLHVPDDVAVVGFDDIPLAAMFDPPLTTVRQPAQEMGATAARMILGLIDGKIERFPEVSLPALLVVRASCGGESKIS